MRLESRFPEGKSCFAFREFVSVELIKKLREMKQQTRLPDVITFAGNGEPTLHPHFSAIIDDTLRIRDEWAPEARIAVLSNSTLLFKSSVFASLKKVDDNILKLDSAVPETIRIMNRPTGLFDLDRLVKQLCRFEGKLVIQTMFLKGSFQGKNFDNTTDAEVEAWIELLEIIRPKRLMIYSIARDTPLKTLEKVGSETLKAIAQKVESRIEINVELA